MNCLLVHAHPLPDSLCRRLASDAQDALRRAGHDVRRLDLYECGFAPALTATERASYYGRYDGSQLLKGWFDRVWAPGVAYVHAADLGRISPRLSSLRRVVAITTLVSPWWVDRLVLRQPVRRVLKHAILGTCAPKAKLTSVSFHGCERLSASSVESMRARAAKVIATI